MRVVTERLPEVATYVVPAWDDGDMTDLPSKRIFVPAAALATLVLAGCGTTPGSAAAGVASSTSSTSSAPSSSTSESTSDWSAPSDDSSSDTSAPSPQEAKIGSSYFKWEDGIEARVTKVRTGRSTSSAAPANTPVVIVTVQVRNSGSSTFDGTMVQVNAAYGADGNSADEVYDSERSLPDDGLDAKILPGKTRTGHYAFAVPAKQAGHVEIQVTPDFSHDTAVFTS